MDDLNNYTEPVREYLKSIKEKIPLNRFKADFVDYNGFVTLTIISNIQLNDSERYQLNIILNNWSYSDFRSYMLDRNAFYSYSYNINKTKIETIMRRTGLNNLI